MCRLLAYAGEPIILDTLLVQPEGSLISQSRAAREARTIVNGDGCGLGWYGEREEPGLYRGILPAWSDDNLVSLCGQLRSGLFLAHVRAATAGSIASTNCHPFAKGRHLFMHNGQVGDWARHRRAVEAMIPDTLYADRAGTSDSEAIFFAALGAGLAGDPIGAMERTIRALMSLPGARAPGAEPLRFAAVLSDGEVVHAFRWASDEQPPSLYAREEGEGILIASEPCGAPSSEWTALPPASVLSVCRRRPRDARLQRFDPLMAQAQAA